MLPRRFLFTSAGFLFLALLVSFWTGTPELSSALIRRCSSSFSALESDAPAPVNPNSAESVKCDAPAPDVEPNLEASVKSDHPNGLRDDFYALSCPSAEAIVTERVTLNLMRDRSVAAALLRMAFHDCFVQGCDASVLLLSDSNGGPAEREAVPNKDSLRGFEVIDDIKNHFESTCPQTVSCADIVVLAARDAVNQVGGPYYSLAKGRRDSLNSSKYAAERQLPQPSFNISEMIDFFSPRGLNETDLVSLLGSHTLGLANCTFFSHRLYNFSNGMPDSSLNINLFYNLTKACPRSASRANISRVPLDPNSTQAFDNSYYKNLMQGRGLLAVDQALMDNPTTATLVHTYSQNQQLFFQDFQRAMVKLSNLAVLSGKEGEIRQNCSVVNRP